MITFRLQGRNRFSVIESVLTVIGARPQFIKAAPVSQALSEIGITETVLHTGQHYDQSMSDVFFAELGMNEPDVHLAVGSGSHGSQTAAMLEGTERILIERCPELVLVYGDTNSTIAGTLAAVKLHVPVAHVEAGLRSSNMRMPEEINRITTDHLSELLFSPTPAATAHLAREGVRGQVHQVGDVMYDATLMFADAAERTSNALERLDVSDGDFALATVHRAESTDDPTVLAIVLNGLRLIAQQMPVVMPLHPRTARAIERAGMAIDASIRVCEPVGFLDMLRLERGAAVIVTDSGGVQKEAFFQRTPCVTLRTETEWVELVESGWNCLVPPTSALAIASAVTSAIGRTGTSIQTYGDGTSAAAVAATIRSFSSEWFSSRPPSDQESLTLT